MVVALTFDDGPSVYTSYILDILQVHGGRVSFFVTGNKIKEHESKLRRASYMGCEIICHGWDHKDLTKLSKRAIKKQLYDTIYAIASATGNVSLMFRPPYGYVDEKVEKVSEYLGLAIVKWSVDPRDWEFQDADTVYSMIMSEVRDGDIILCHDLYDSTVVAMSRLIPEFIDRGVELVTVSELLKRKYGYIEPGRLYLK